MLNPDFENYSLALVKDDKIIFKSTRSGLRPLVECINKFYSKVNACILHDRVIGLAAAKLIVYSNIISKVRSEVCSEYSGHYLLNNEIDIITDKIVKNILTKDKLSICPMELKAKNMEDNKLFYLQLKKML